MARKKKEVKIDPPKVAIFDLETAGLEANRAHILCAALKWLGKKEIKTWRIDDTPAYGTTPASWTNDGPVAQAVADELVQADAVIAYYGGYGRFDVPYLNTRLISNGLDPLPFVTVIDPHRTARYALKLARNDMGSVAALFKTEHAKVHLPWEDWLAAKYGDRKAMDRILKYNINDIKVLEDLYLKMRPLIHNHPYVAQPVPGQDITMQCPSCGSMHSHSRGSRTTKSFRLFRRQCQTCGSFFDSYRKKHGT